LLCLVVIKIGSTLKNYEFCSKRSILGTIAQILKETNTAVNKTQIMYKCNLNYKQLEIYTKILLEKNLLARKTDNNGQVTFIATPRGNDFVKKFHLLQAQL
jgi:predicted transcriptional regulator